MQQYLYKAMGTTLGITYITSLLTVNALLRLALNLETDRATRQTIAVGLGLLVVATPLWWLQWRWICRHFVTATLAQRQQFHTYVLSTALVALVGLFAGAGISVAVLAQLALGLLTSPLVGWVQSLVAIVAMLIAAAIWHLHWRYVAENAQTWETAKSGR